MHSEVLDNISNYFTRFPLSFPYAALKGLHPGCWVFDPFCGCGVTLFAARLRNLHAVGVDNNPVAVAIAASKSLHLTAHAIIERATSIFCTASYCPEPPSDEFWQLCFAPHVFQAICRFKEYFLNRPLDNEDVMLRAIFLGLLHGPRINGHNRFLSNDMPSSYAPPRRDLIRHWSTHHLSPDEADVLQLIQSRATLLLDALPPPNISIVHKLDSFSLSPVVFKEPVDCVVTSPPYFGFDGFLASQWLRLWFLGYDLKPAPALKTDVDLNGYVRRLSHLWALCAEICRPKARLAVRFGVIQGYAEVLPFELLQWSLDESGAEWRIRKWRKISPPISEMSPAEWFLSPAPRPLSEIELFAELDK